VPVTDRRGNINVAQTVVIGVDEAGFVRGLYVNPDPRMVAAIALETFREPLPA
jgi:hypothetical protein